jgi:hypothetical protein
MAAETMAEVRERMGIHRPTLARVGGDGLRSAVAETRG